MMFQEDETRIRQKAHEIWLAEGQPEGRAQAHWQMARELIAQAANQSETLRPNPAQGGAEAPLHDEPVEPPEAVAGLGDLPDLDDQGDKRAYPSRDALREQ
jgi:hypothetical protein